MSETYSLFLNNEEFFIPRDFELLIKLPKKVSSILVSKLRYTVESNVPREIFQTYINYIIDNTKLPKITSDNIFEFRLLSEEFNFLSEYVIKPELDAIFQVSLLKKAFLNGSQDRSKFELFIAQKLDLFLKEYSSELCKIHISPLYNIFYHKDRILEDHNLAYEFITNNEQSKPSLSVLLGSLDGSKLKRESLKDSISNREKHFGFMPIISNGFIENMIGCTKETEIQHENADQKLKEMAEKHHEEIKKLNEKNDQKMNELTSNHATELELIKKQYEEKISTLTQTINEMKAEEMKNKEILEQEKKWHKIECPFKNNELNGIISFLKSKLNDSAVKLTGGGKTSDIHPIENIIKYDTEHINKYYFNYFNIVTTKDQNWIQFDFNENRKIQLSSYTIRTNDYDFHPKSWMIKGSNDLKSWDPIDVQENKSELNGANKQHHFVCKNESKFFRYVKYIQNDSWGRNKPFNIYLTCIELFGSILSKDLL